MGLTHIDENGAARMVDVGDKEYTHRTAKAQAVVTMKAETLELIREGNIKKGDVFSCARIAGIMAAKKTFEIIPMCHPLPLEKIAVDMDFKWCKETKNIQEVYNGFEQYVTDKTKKDWYKK